MGDEYIYILEKSRRFCAYQERCIFDLKKKLYEWKVRPVVMQKIVSALEDEDYLNEERFARVFTSGKFRIKKWGRNKIKAGLRGRRISDQSIQLGLDEIDEQEYLEVLEDILEKKRTQIERGECTDVKRKLYNFALSRGFESHLVMKLL